MSRRERGKRYGILLPGIFLVAFGISFITKSHLGSSPIAAIPYTVWLIAPALSYGVYTVIWNVLLVLSQWAMLRREARVPELWAQIGISFLLGPFVDLSMWILTPLDPQRYVERLFVLVIGCAVLAAGAYVQLIAGVAMSPGDGHARVLTWFTKRSYSRVRIAQDMSFTLVAMLLSLLFLHGLQGAREGTVASAFLVGFIVGQYKRVFDGPFLRWMERHVVTRQ